MHNRHIKLGESIVNRILQHSDSVSDFNYLEHHGIKGQKWGVRRYQNEGGSYKNGAKGMQHDSDSNKESNKINVNSSKEEKEKYAKQTGNEIHKLYKELEKERDQKYFQMVNSNKNVSDYAWDNLNNKMKKKVINTLKEKYGYDYVDEYDFGVVSTSYIDGKYSAKYKYTFGYKTPDGKIEKYKISKSSS